VLVLSHADGGQLGVTIDNRSWAATAPLLCTAVCKFVSISKLLLAGYQEGGILVVYLASCDTAAASCDAGQQRLL
jgi:hypothetical protein